MTQVLKIDAAGILASAGAWLAGAKRTASAAQLGEVLGTSQRALVAGPVDVDGTVTLPANSALGGVPGHALRQIAEPAGGPDTRLYSFRLASGVAIEDVAFRMVDPISGTSGFYLLESRPGVDGVRIQGVDADYGQTIDPTTGQPNALGGIISLLSDTATDRLSISHSRFRNFFWGFLKGNAATSVEKHLSITFSEFSNLGSTALLFNSPHPSSLMQNILVLGNTLGANNSRYQWDSALPGFGHKATFAGNVRFGRFIANHAEGAGDQMVRAEEGAEGIIWALNTGEFEGYNAAEIVPAQAGGDGMKTPRRFAIASNVFHHKGTPVGHPKGPGTGIKLHANAGDPATNRDATLRESALVGNVLSGFDEGIRHSWGTETLLTTNNVLADCAKGLQIYQPTLGTRDNLVSGAGTAAVHFEHGGLIGPVHFRPDPEDLGPFEAIVTRVRARAGLTGWTWETGYYDTPDYASSTTYPIPIIRTGALMSGEIIASLMQRDQFLYTVLRGTVLWDGTTFTWTTAARTTTGSLLISNTSFIRDGDGKLALQLVTGGGGGGVYEAAKLQIEFRGMHVFN